MKKVLIISYFFPPCNLTAANRIESWQNYLHEFDVYPIIITRNWTGAELTEFQRLENSEGDNTIQNEQFEVHSLQYKSNLRDRIFIKGEKNSLYKYLSRLLTLINLIGQNFSLKSIPYNNLYYKAEEVLENDKTIETVIISGNPFEQFYFGYLLKKNFPRVNWIADYRDDWSTSELIRKRSFINKLIHNLEKKSEKEWLSNASLFTSVSPHYVEKISRFINKKGEVLFNGFNLDLLEKESQTGNNNFLITYNGSLYETQNIESFIIALKKVIDQYKDKIEIKLLFPGLEYDNTQFKRIINLLSGYEKYYWTSNRITKNEVIELQIKSDLLLMVAHENIKGVPSSKIFEYIGLRKPILLCPSDNDILKEIVESVEFGSIANDIETCFNILEKKIMKKIKAIKEPAIDSDEIMKYSSKEQVKKLAHIIHRL